ncbi:MAG: SEC-C domain-containing protein, partial [Actinomycetota bacterium]|nr:SEC-C domain-containing protein [Actinomycetota bacterium]
MDRPGAGAAVGPRQPCPCGSGRRYKNCHGRGDVAAPLVTRTFEGLPGECDWVAMREFVPAASAPLALRDGDREVVVASLLPLAAPALVRGDGSVWIGLQVTHHSGDASRDCAAALEAAADAERGQLVSPAGLPATGTRLQDVVAADAEFVVTVHDGFDFWLAGVEDPTGRLAASLEAADAAMTPTRRLESVEAAYWCDVRTKEHLRWVLPHDEDQLLDGLARLHAADADRLGDGTRLVGSFRAHGLLVPVWDLPSGCGAAALEE